MVENLLVSIVAGLFGLIPLILQWLSDRSKTKSKHDRILKFSNELEFLEKWVNLYSESLTNEKTQQVQMAPQSVQSDLERILAEYRYLREESELGEQERPSKVSFIRRMLLLFRPSTEKARLIHSIFYFLLIFAIAMLVSDLQSPTFDPQTGENEFGDLLLGIIIFLGPPLLLLQRAAIRLRAQGIKH